MATDQVSSTGTQTTGHGGKQRMNRSLARHLWVVGGSKKGPQATGHQGGFPPTSQSMPPTGSPQGPCTKVSAGRSGVSDPLLGLPQSVHWSVWDDPETPIVWTPTGTSEWGCGCICLSKAHMVHWPPCGSIKGWSRQCPALCDHTMPPGELAHRTPPTHVESWKGDSA